MSDVVLKNPTVYHILVKGIWILFNKGYRIHQDNKYSLKYILNNLSSVYRFDAFSAMNIFITQELDTINEGRLFENIQSLKDLPVEFL